MPIKPQFPIRRLSQSEFGEISYEVMKHVFEIHNQIGGFFSEEIYKQELARRLPQAQIEGPIDIWFESFRTRYFVDIVVGDGGIFELKTVERLKGRHRAQLINYLLICDIPHGKLINLRGDTVEHEFINSQRRFSDTRRFRIESDRFDLAHPEAKRLHDYVFALLSDLGAGLEISLYEEAICQFLGGS